MPPGLFRKSATDLKRPELQGTFICASCDGKFAHAASLNRHRINHHSAGQMCLQCNHKLGPQENMREHMQATHGIFRIFTCQCCNWSFSNKKDLVAHRISIREFGVSGNSVPIAISENAPGSLTQKAITGVSPKKKNCSLKRRHSTETGENSLSSCSSRASSPTISPPPAYEKTVVAIIQTAYPPSEQFGKVEDPPCKIIKIKQRPQTLDEKREHLKLIVNRLAKKVGVI